MGYERIEGKIFLARKGIPKSENVTLAISFLTIACWHQMTENNFKRCFLIYLNPLSSISKSKVGKVLHMRLAWCV